tara:strand:- start:1481 stop:1867 length:387 start_codon:yes stop_codon:yes gene_type:complete
MMFIPSVLAHSYHNDQERKVFFITPSNGEVLTNPIKIVFGATGVKIVPAGVEMPRSGHHHLLIDVDKLPDLKSPIPADNNHLHFGAGQTEVEINLPEGKHTLQLLLGNHLHIPHADPLLSEKIEITVK